MNLKEFINLRERCPMCDAVLTTILTGRQQKNKFEEDRFVAIFIMRAMRNAMPDYEVGYSFGLEDNTFQVEFYTEWDTRNNVPVHLLTKFEDFHKNLSKMGFRFVRTCNVCDSYEMNSEPVDVDLRKCRYGSIEKFDESFLFSDNTGTNNRFILLDNYIGERGWISELSWWRSPLDHKVDWPIPSNSSVRGHLPLIPFVSKEETGERLNKLIMFS